MDSEVEKVKASILEIRDSLSEPLKGFLNKQIEKAAENFKEAKCITYFDTCLKDAKRCKKTARDFPSQWSRDLTTDNALFNTFRYKLLSVCVVDNPPSDIDKIKYKIYGDVQEILEELLSSKFYQTYKLYQIRDSIKKNILELLILLLSKKENVVFNKEHSVFFAGVRFLVKQDTINLTDCLGKIDKIEKSEYFFPKNLDNIRDKFVAVIFSIDRSILYRNLLYKIEELAEREFSDQPAVLNFINCFVLELVNKKNYFYETTDEDPNERFDFGMVLIYQALNRKSAQRMLPSSKLIFKRLIKLPPKSTFGSQLSKFKQDYYYKTGKEFPWEILSKGQFGRGEQVQRLPEEIAVYFDRHEINRSSKFVRKVVEIALGKYGKLKPSEDRQTKTTPIERVNKFKAKGIGLWKAAGKGMEVVKKGIEKGVEKLTDLLDDASNKAMDFIEKGQEMKEVTIDLVKDTVSNVKLSAPIFYELSEEDKNKLSSLRAELENMPLQLYEIKSLLKQSIDHRCVEENTSRSTIITHDKGLNDEEYVNNIETQSKVIKINIDNVYSKAINKSILEIGETIQLNSWFKDKKTSLMESINAFFIQGCFYVNLDKFKNRLNDKIDFVSEKDFFLKAGFFSLLRYGVIRWPWWNKEDFAINWAEQIILLKTKDYIEKTMHEEINKANFLLKLIKLHGEVFYRLDKKDFFSDLYQDINNAGIAYFSEMANLREKINCRIGVVSKADSSVAPNTAAFFNAGNKEPEPSDQSSATFGVTQNTF